MQNITIIYERNACQVHGLYSRKIAPIVSIIHKEIQDSIKISKYKLTLTLFDLEYTYKKKGDIRIVLNTVH
jgi:hypothetical protein